jgi:RimJ/RimL family protein N-acetyltransferase
LRLTSPSVVCVQLRDVELGDVAAYVQMRCDARMMTHLGGPRPIEEMADKVRRDVADVRSGRAWICMIVPDGEPNAVAGTVTLWSHEGQGAPLSEIGWMVLPEYQGLGLAKAAVRSLLARARDERRWGVVHAYPAVANGPSNAICRSLAFEEVGEEDLDYAQQVLRVNHWSIDPEASAWAGPAS